MKSQLKIFHGLSCHSWGKMELCSQTYYQVFYLHFYENLFIFCCNKRNELPQKIHLSCRAASTTVSLHGLGSVNEIPYHDSIGQFLAALLIDELVPVSQKVIRNGAHHCWHSWDLATLLSTNHHPDSYAELWNSLEIFSCSFPYAAFFFFPTPHHLPLSVSWSCATTQENNIPPYTPHIVWIYGILISCNVPWRQ